MGRLLRTISLCVLLALALGACLPESEAPPDPAELVHEAQADLAAGEMPEAIDKLRLAIRLDPGLAEAHFWLGRAYAVNALYLQAADAFREAARLQPDYTEAYTNLGAVYHELRRYPEAEEAFRAAAQLQPDNAEIQYNLGSVLLAQDKLDEAGVAFARACDDDPSMPEPRLGLANVYRIQGHTDEAAAELHEFLRLSSDPEWRARAEAMLRELGEEP